MLWTSLCLVCTGQTVSLMNILSGQSQREHPCSFKGEHPKLHHSSAAVTTRNAAALYLLLLGDLASSERNGRGRVKKGFTDLLNTGRTAPPRALGWITFPCCPRLAVPERLLLAQGRSLCWPQDLGQALTALHLWTLLQRGAVLLLQGAQGCRWGQLVTTIAGSRSLAERWCIKKKSCLLSSDTGRFHVEIEYALLKSQSPDHF